MKNIHLIDSLKRFKTVARRYYGSFLARGGIDLITFTLYYFFCKLIYKKNNNFLNRNEKKSFKENKVLVINSLIEPNVVDLMAENFDKRINTRKFDASYIAYKGKKLGFIKRNLNRFLLNADITYKFPMEYLEQVKLLVNPILNIDALGSELSNKFIPILNQLMDSSTNIHRVLAFETINKDKKETENLNGKIHKDGDIWTAIKCIIYLTDVDENNGPFSYLDKNSNLISVKGKKGTAIFFKSSELFHKGSNTLSGRRIALSFTSYPHYKNAIPESDFKLNYNKPTIPFLPVSNKLKIK